MLTNHEWEAAHRLPPLRNIKEGWVLNSADDEKVLNPVQEGGA
jgi:hypothetical protein